MNMKNKIWLIQLVLMIIFLALIIFSPKEVNTKEDTVEIQIDALNVPEHIKNPTISKYWDENDVPFIHIEGNWTETNNTYDWCTGKGTLDEPYIIENISINALNKDFGICVNNSKNIYFIIRNCTVYNAKANGAGIWLENTDNGTLIDNNCSWNYGAGIMLWYCNYNNLSDNYFNNNQQNGIYMYYSEHNNLTKNHADNNFQFGIQMDGYNDYNNISYNTFYNNDYSGIYVLDSDYNLLLENNASYNGANGINLGNAKHNTILNNNIHNNKYNGTRLYGGSNNNVISGNNIYDNDYNGIGLETSIYSIITDNTINGNVGYGIYLYRSNDSLVIVNSLNNNYGCIFEKESKNNIISKNLCNGNYPSLIIDESGAIGITWTEAVFIGWCTGKGTWSDPYILEDFTFFGESWGVGIWVNNSKNLYFIIRKCTVFGAGVIGIKLQNTTNGKIIDNNCTDCRFTQKGYHLVESHNNTLTNNIGNCIYLESSENNTILDNSVRGMFLSYSNYNNIKGNTIYQTTIGDDINVLNSQYNNFSWNTLLDNNGRGIYLKQSNNTIITRNTLINNTMGSIIEEDCKNNLIVVNVINGTTTSLVIDESGLVGYTWSEVAVVYWCTGNGTKNNPFIIKDIFFNATGKPYGILINNSINGYFIIKNCTVLNASEAGIKLHFTNNGTLLINNCSQNKASGIYLLNSNNNTISGNVASFNINYGIFLNMSHNNTITDNTANNNDIHGIYLLNSDNNTISGNTETINNNDICGIFLEFCNWNDISDNIANYNGIYGICLNSSDYNTVIGNKFIGNKIPYYEDENSEDNKFENNIISEGVVSEGDDDDEKEKEKPVIIPGYDLFILISMVFVFIGVSSIILIKKRFKL